MQRRYRLLLALGVLATMIVHGWSILRFPGPFMDETWLISRAWGFHQTGKTFGMLDAGVIDRYPGYWTFLPALSNSLQSLALWLAGGPSLLAARLQSLLYGGILLLAIWVIARRLGGGLAAWISVTLVAYSTPFWFTAHSARQDILVAACSYGAIALWFIAAERPRWWLHLLAGLVLGAAVEIHSFAAIFVPVLFTLYVQRHGWRAVRQAEFWWWALGGIIGLLFYIGIHILPYPQSYVALTDIYFGRTHLPPLLSLDLPVIVDGVRRTFEIVTSYSFLSPLQALALVWLCVRPAVADSRWLAIMIPLLLAYILLIHTKFGYYTIYFSPALEMGLALAAARLIANPPARVRPLLRKALVVALAAWALIAIGASIQLIGHNSYADYTATIAQLDPVIKPGDVIMSTPMYWLDFPEHPYYTIEQLVFYPRHAPGSTVEQTMAEFKPDILIVDFHLRSHTFKEMPQDPYAQAWFIPQDQLDAAIARHGTEVANFMSRDYGQVVVYRMRWP